jgi:hypothetical protein
VSEEVTEMGIISRQTLSTVKIPPTEMINVTFNLNYIFPSNNVNFSEPTNVE